MVQHHSVHFPWSLWKICKRQHFKAYWRGADPCQRTGGNIYDGFQDRILEENFLELKSIRINKGIWLLFGFDWEGRVSVGLAGGQEGWHQWTQCSLLKLNSQPRKGREKVNVGEALTAKFWILALQQLAVPYVNTETKVSKVYFWDSWTFQPRDTQTISGNLLHWKNHTERKFYLLYN